MMQWSLGNYCIINYESCLFPAIITKIDTHQVGVPTYIKKKKKLVVWDGD